MADTVFFYIFAAIILGGAVLTITRRNAVHSAIFLIPRCWELPGCTCTSMPSFLPPYRWSCTWAGSWCCFCL